MDIIPPHKLRNHDIEEDLNIINDDPFVRPKRKPTEKQLENLKKGRMTLREKREREREALRNNNSAPTKMPSRQEKQHQEEQVARAEQLLDFATPTQQKKIEQIKELSQEELDEKEFDKFIKMMGKFENMVSKLELKKQKELEEQQRKEQEMEQKYYAKFLAMQKNKQDDKSPFVQQHSVTRTEPVNPNPLGLTEEEQKYSKYF